MLDIEDLKMDEQDKREARRQFVKKAAYVAPAILTLAAAPSFAKAGSTKNPKHKPEKPEKRPKPPKR